MVFDLSILADRIGASLSDAERRLLADAPLIDSLLTDSRSLADAASTLFFAISTPTGDGARFVEPLAGKGVRYFVVSHDFSPSSPLPEGCVLLRVDSPRQALQTAASRPDDFAGEIVGITGSRGKTSLKEWLFRLCEPLTPSVRSPRSFNSQIGVPLSMAEIEPDTRLAFIEAGVSRRGEMAALRRIIQPDTVIVTNIGADHDEGFASRAEKAREKLDLVHPSRTRRIIFCADDTVVAEAVACRIAAMAYEASGEIRLAGWSVSDNAGALYRFEAIPDFQHGRGRLRCLTDAGLYDVSFEARDNADIQNACHALAFLIDSGIAPQTAAEGFALLRHIDTRLSVSEGSYGCDIVFDSYSSDAASLPQALDFTIRRRMPGQKATVILSDPHCASRDQEKAFRRIARSLESREIDRFIGVGPLLKAHSNLFGPDAIFFESTAQLLSALSARDFRDEIILLKGTPEAEFDRVLEMLEARTHETVLEVNLDAITRNFNYFRSHVPASTGIVCMVKAGAYGAGSLEIAKTLQDAGAAYLAVAVLDEGIDLRRNGITMPLMVMNPKVANYRLMFANRLEPEIYTFSMLHDVIDAAARYDVKDYPIHLKLDTGMHRMGFSEDELPAVADLLRRTDRVALRSVFSHLATADCPDMNDYTHRQLATFRRASDYLREAYGRPFMRHILNSAGILRFPEHHYDMVRLGIGLYGVNTLPPEMEKPLDCVSALRTVVIALREYKAGETIGYGRKGVLTRDSLIATIPIGYADGMNRHFGRGAIRVLVRGQEAPTIGNICMDACMIDVTGLDVREGDPVEIFGPRMSVQRLADTLDTIPYEILTSVSPRVKRVYYRE